MALVGSILWSAGAALSGAPGTTPDEVAAIERAMSAAEQSLRSGQLASAEARYRSALNEGERVMGTLESGEASSPARAELRRRVRSALAGAYLNLGVMRARSERFAEAAALFEKAAELDPGLPQVQYSLGVAYFNARRYDQATGPLSRALAERPGPELRRMLATAWLNTKAYDKAADLLRDDPELGANPSLAFAYGLALVKSDRGAEAERVFSQLIVRHGDSAELSVLMGQAHAQQGEFEAARESLRRALQLQPGVAEANATLGIISLREGHLAEAEQALRAELKEHPGDASAQQNLAIVLDAEQRSAEAIPLLRGLLESEPERATARYLLGKILLARGDAAAALEQLETATRQAPEDAKIRYQLGQAYQRLGRAELAEQQFELFRQLKAKR